MRIKRGQAKQKKHKKIIKLAKGYRGSYGTLYKRSKEAVLHAGQYNFAHRRRRRSQIKQSWVRAINAALTSQDINYSQFRNKLSEKNVELNSKMLAELAIDRPEDFNKIVAQVK